MNRGNVTLHPVDALDRFAVRTKKPRSYAPLHFASIPLATEIKRNSL